MDYQNVILENQGEIAVLTLNRPEKRNALDPKTWEEIQDAIRRCRRDKAVKVVIITGAGGTQRLQRLVGIGKAKELIFTGDIIGAGEAREIGLVNQVVEKSEDLLPRALEMAGKIRAKGPVAIAMSKAAINVGANSDIYTGLMFEKFAQTVAFSTQDRIEGTSAFLEKRKPVFKGE